ncbi:MAG: CRISPR-associated endonuclease Cas2 [Chitinophagales bacterium]|nr:CRISPR-associated endonuclease Cas2 [Chitinophagales bacterium]
MPFKARKKFVVICYDVTKTKLRKKVADELEKYGERANYSVFECMLTQGQLILLKEKLETIIDKRTDTILYYPLCVDCFAKMQKQPPVNIKRELVVAA